jgi:hypothetical protein
MLERRNPLRRAVCGGAVVGALGGVCAGAANGLVLATMVNASVVHAAGGAAAMVATSAGLYAAAGVIVGALLGALYSVSDPAVDAIARKRQRRVGAAASLYTIFATPVIALVWSYFVDGPWAVGWPSHGWLKLGGAVVLCGAVHLGLYGALACAERIDLAARRGEGNIGPALCAALVLAAAAVGLRVWDVGVGPSASEPETALHMAASVGALGLWLLAVLSASKAARAGERRWGKLAAPRAATIVAGIAIMLGALALARLDGGGDSALARRELLRARDALVGGVVVRDE